jgi:predicted GNAT superfamily acetyltransferase
VRVSDEPLGIEIRELTTADEAHEAARVLAAVWPGDRQAMPANILRALAHSGNYVVGVFDGERMVGASAAFFGPPASRSMHSHITGVLADLQGSGIGRRLKQHQREWAFARGVGRITWTFDPLMARNAHFNLRVLGARVTEYLVDQYGPMDDDVNRGDASDRLMVTWDLASPPARTPDFADVAAEVMIPGDIETMRRETPAAAAAWRRVVRDMLVGHLAAGLRIAGFDDERGYLLVPA